MARTCRLRTTVDKLGAYEYVVDFLADVDFFDGAFLEEPRADDLVAVFFDDFLAVFFLEAVDFFATRQGPLFASTQAGRPSVEGPPSTVERGQMVPIRQQSRKFGKTDAILQRSYAIQGRNGRDIPSPPLWRGALNDGIRDPRGDPETPPDRSLGTSRTGA